MVKVRTVRPLQGYKTARLSLDELVAAANDLLPEILPGDIADQRLKEELTPRLVRHYSSQGGLEEPLREGREARYTYLHLLQLLALRLLQAEGHKTGAVTPLTSSMNEGELEALVRGHRQVTLSQTHNPALDFLHNLKGGGGVATPPITPTPPPASRETRWLHHEIVPGLVLQVRQDLKLPPDLAPLLEQIQKALMSGHRRTSR